MAKPKSLTPKLRKELQLDPRLVYEVELYLRRDISGKIAYDEWNKLVTSLLTQYLQKQVQGVLNVRNQTINAGATTGADAGSINTEFSFPNTDLGASTQS